MQKEKWSIAVVSTVLTGVLCIVLMAAGRSIYDYYTGPVRVMTLYTNMLNERAYHKMYELLDAESIAGLGSKEDIVSYYKKCYDGQLVQVQGVSKPKLFRENEKEAEVVAEGELYYTFANHKEEQSITMVKKSGKWYVLFPFEAQTVTIEAPKGSQVYFNDKEVKLYQDGNYVVEHVLPGKYYVQVILPHEDYNDYFKVISVPKQTDVSLPYTLNNLVLHTMEGMDVQLGDMKKLETGKGVRFDQILPGKYKLTISHPLGFVEPIEEEIVVSDNHQITRDDLVLSSKGKTAYNDFFRAFYNDYLTSIKTGDLTYVSNDLSGTQKEEILKTFDDWFINQKQIVDAKINIVPTPPELDEQGYLWTTVFETIELTNQEEEENMVYQLQLKWHMQISMREGELKVVDRELLESLVAYKDKNDKWIQY